MFSPFRAPDGGQKTIAEVTWDDLAQLKDMDEGFVLEFKCANTASVRRKIPKIVASFANSRGGWLVIGIADDTKEVTPIPRPQADFSQTVGELCRRHVSPAPPFEARFLEDPADAERGVAIVQVGEGDFPPYVADGRVEIREGSTSGPATGGELVELYGKATRRHTEVAGFCHRTVFFPDAGPAGAVPLFDLYLYRMGIRPAEAVGRAEVEAHLDAMRTCFSRQGMECHVQHAHDSLILRGTPPLRLGEAHSAIELFGDESMKLTVPAVPLDGTERARALEELAGFGQHVPEGSVIVDARQTLRRVTLPHGHGARPLRARARALLAGLRRGLRAREHGRRDPVERGRGVPRLREAPRRPVLRDHGLPKPRALPGRRLARLLPRAAVRRQPLLRGLRPAARLARPGGHPAGGRPAQHEPLTAAGRPARRPARARASKWAPILVELCSPTQLRLCYSANLVNGR